MNAAQYAYDNQYDATLEVPFDAGFDDFPATEENKTYLVEQFVTHHNAIAFVFGGSEPSLQWLAKQIGFDADHWSVGFVADELEELLK